MALLQGSRTLGGCPSKSDHWLAALPPGFAGALGLQWAPPLVAGTAAAFVPAPVCMHLLGVHLLELVLLLQLGLPAVA